MLAAQEREWEVPGANGISTQPFFVISTTASPVTLDQLDCFISSRVS